MSFIDPDKKRAYHREYMQRRRGAVKPVALHPPCENETDTALIPAQEGPGAPGRLDRTRPYTVESRFPWPAYFVQDGYWYHWETWEFVGAAK